MPTKYPLYTLDEIAEIRNGATPRTQEKKYWSEGTHLWLTPDDLSNAEKYTTNSKRRITSAGLKSINGKLAPSNSIVLSTRAPIGYVTISQQPTVTNQGCKTLIPKEGSILPEYLYYLLVYFKRELIKRGAGSTFAEISLTSLKKVEVPVPDLSSQKKITQLMGDLDKEILKTQEIIEQVERMKKGLMQKLFMHPNNPEIPLSDIAQKIGDGIHSTPHYSDQGEYFFINGNNLVHGAVKVYEKTKRINAIEYKRLKQDITDNSLLMSINGTIGNLAYYENEPVLLGKSAAYINLASPADRDYLYYFLQTKNTKSYFTNELTGTTISNLSLKSIRNLPVIMPPAEERQMIVDSFKSIDKKLDQNKQIKTQLILLKKGLMSELLTGRVSV